MSEFEEFIVQMIVGVSAGTVLGLLIVGAKKLGDHMAYQRYRLAGSPPVKEYFSPSRNSRPKPISHEETLPNGHGFGIEFSPHTTPEHRAAHIEFMRNKYKDLPPTPYVQKIADEAERLMKESES